MVDVPLHSVYPGSRIIEANRLTDYPDVIYLNAGETYGGSRVRQEMSWCFVSKGRIFVQIQTFSLRLHALEYLFETFCLIFETRCIFHRRKCIRVSKY